MTALEAYRVMADWQRLLVYGTEDRLAQLLSEIELRLPASDWQLDPDLPPRPECRGTEQCGGVGLVYSYSQVPADARPWRLRLGLRRLTRRFQAVRPEVLGNPYGVTYPAQAESVAAFRAAVLDPALTACTLEPVPDVFVTSRVPDRLLDLLLDFSDRTDRAWPLSPEGEQAWRAVVISAYRGEAAIDRDELVTWLEAVGWPQVGAGGLADRYDTDARLLREYDEVFKSGATTSTTTAPARSYI